MDSFQCMIEARLVTDIELYLFILNSCHSRHVACYLRSTSNEPRILNLEFFIIPGSVAGKSVGPNGVRSCISKKKPVFCVRFHGSVFF